jgi:multidrug resistance efflux pump
MTARVQDLRGRFVAAHTLLSEIGDCRTLVADLPVSERLLSDVKPGFPVKALARQDPLGPLQGKVSGISTATLDRPATTRGISEPVAPRELPDRFAIRAVFDNGNGRLRPGDRIRAKIYCAREAFAYRAWRVLWRWLRSVAW